MSNETGQVKHPFRFIKPKNNDTKAITSYKRFQAVKVFKVYIENVTKDMENCHVTAFLLSKMRIICQNYVY